MYIGIVEPIYRNEFLKRMKEHTSAFDDFELTAIYDDLQEYCDEAEECIVFDPVAICCDYHKGTLYFPKDEEEYKEWLDNKELGMTLYDEAQGSFRESNIDEADIICASKDSFLYRGA